MAEKRNGEEVDAIFVLFQSAAVADSVAADRVVDSVI